MNTKGIPRGFPTLAWVQEAQTWNLCCAPAFGGRHGTVLYGHHWRPLPAFPPESAVKRRQCDMGFCCAIEGGFDGTTCGQHILKQRSSWYEGVPYACGPHLFHTRRQFHGKQLFHRLGWKRMVLGWFKCMTFIVNFISIIIASAPHQIIKC